MRKNVINKHSLYTRLPLAILCAIYQDLTGNAINNSNLISKEVQERIKLIFKGTKFDEFWNEMDAYFNEVIAISIQELRESIIERLKAKHDEEKSSKVDPTVTQNNTSKNKLRAYQTITTGDFNQLHFIPDPQISSDHQRFSIHYMDVILLEVDLQSKKNNLVCQEPAPDGMLVAARVVILLFVHLAQLCRIFSKYVLGESDSEQPWKRLHIHVVRLCFRKSSFSVC
ncbi:hypothetical protein RhiirA4_468206 [Rhizophagus irregularis]|uniref:Uncharacterized protein n=1 Tax=Rhizophagus irregularis TaxID=588596 RepID=A0A2I1GXB6_9GLOM|nr:hypothetical protein RhiirA4_468206 [Rhizophagus irregularis]